MNRLWNRLVRAGESLLAATAEICAYCGQRVKHYPQRSFRLCGKCYAEIPWIETIGCKTCGRGEPCPDCERRGPSPLLLNRSAVKYDPKMKEWLAAYKFRRNERLNVLFVEMLHQTYRRHLSGYFPNGRPDAVAFVPVSAARLDERGFNQAEQLARGIAERLGVPSVPLLKRVKDTEKQSRKSRAERLKDLRDVFALEDQALKRLLKNGMPEPINIIIIDDVYTTGSTLHACAETIARHMQAHLYGLTWAR